MKASILNRKNLRQKISHYHKIVHHVKEQEFSLLSMTKHKQDSTVLVTRLPRLNLKGLKTSYGGFCFAFCQLQLLHQLRAVIQARYRYIATRLQHHLLFPVTPNPLVSDRQMKSGHFLYSTLYHKLCEKLMTTMKKDCKHSFVKKQPYT